MSDKEKKNYLQSDLVMLDVREYLKSQLYIRSQVILNKTTLFINIRCKVHVNHSSNEVVIEQS